MVKVLRALWLVVRSSRTATTVVEAAGAAAIVYGIDIQAGRGPAWIAAGVACVLKAFEMDLDRPGGPSSER